MNMSKYTQIGSVKWLRKTIMWQEIITTLLSKYIWMKNHLAATHVKSNFYKLPISNAVMWKTGFYSWDKKFTELLRLNDHVTIHRLKTICLLLMWQEIFCTPMSEYTRIKNHLAASHWTWNFSELSTLLLTKTFHFQNTWNNIPGVCKQTTAACIFQDNKSSEKFLVTSHENWVQPNGFSSECILT